MAAGAVLFAAAYMVTRKVEINETGTFFLFFLAYIVSGMNVAGRFWVNIKNREILEENFLIILATLGTFVIGSYIEGVAVILFFQLGNLMEDITVNRSRKTIRELMNIEPQTATVKRNGKEIEVTPDKLRVNNVIIIKPGEKVPTDCVITEGNSSIDAKALTGESMPFEVEAGDAVYGGSINMNGVLTARVVRTYEKSSVSMIKDMVQEAEEKKASSERIIRKFAKIYTPVIVAGAVFLCVVPFITKGAGNIEPWVYRGLIFLIAACPCGIVMSVPIAFIGGIGASARQGILVKGGNFLEALAQVDTMVFDKTGTLTEGIFEVKEVKPVGMSVDELLKIAVHVEGYSNHPISESLKKAYGKPLNKHFVKKIKELPGYGISATVLSQRVYIGNARLMRLKGISFTEQDLPGTIVYVAIGKKYAGYILIADKIKEDAKETVEFLRDEYQMTVAMMTGDTRLAAEEISNKVELDYTYWSLLPEDKMNYLERFMELQKENEKLAFVGDGVNDAPVLARADVGIAMGGIGADAAVEAADVVLVEDEPSKIILAVQIAKETIDVVRQNIMIAVLIKAVVLVLSLFGYMTMWNAILSEVVVIIVSIINAAWVMKYAAL